MVPPSLLLKTAVTGLPEEFYLARQSPDLIMDEGGLSFPCLSRLVRDSPGDSRGQMQ